MTRILKKWNSDTLSTEADNQIDKKNVDVK